MGCVLKTNRYDHHLNPSNDGNRSAMAKITSLYPLPLSKISRGSSRRMAVTRFTLMSNILEPISSRKIQGHYRWVIILNLLSSSVASLDACSPASKDSSWFSNKNWSKEPDDGPLMVGEHNQHLKILIRHMIS